MMAINLCADHFSEWYDGGMPCDYCKQQKRTAELEAENEDWSQKWTESEIENQRLEQLFLNEERLREATTEEKDAKIAELEAKLKQNEDACRWHQQERLKAERHAKDKDADSQRLKKLFYDLEATSLGPVEVMRSTGIIRLSYQAFCDLHAALQGEGE